MNEREQIAFQVLVQSALVDTASRGRTCADFILAWSCPAMHGGFALPDIFRLDAYHARSMLTVFDYLSRQSYPVQPPEEYRDDIDEIARRWRAPPPA